MQDNTRGKNVTPPPHSTSTSTSTSTLERTVFDREIREIQDKARRIGDTWRLVESFPQSRSTLYLEKSEQKSISNDIYTFVYHVIFSEAYSVPVLYLNAFKSTGRGLNYDEMYSYFKLNRSNNVTTPGDDDEDEDMAANRLILTQEEHPILFKPFYFLHPCKTVDWMKATQIETSPYPGSNFTLKWLSFVLASLSIPFDLRYAIEY
jgi:ubiquitin-like-conjugating enzyme ATG10